MLKLLTFSMPSKLIRRMVHYLTSLHLIKIRFISDLVSQKEKYKYFCHPFSKNNTKIWKSRPNIRLRL